MKKRKLLAALIAGIMATSLFVGCGKSDSGTTGEKKSITIWSHLTKAEVDEVQKVASEWGEKNNVEVKVVEDKGDFQALIQAANSPEGPDIMLGYPHDNLGTFQKAGIVSEIPEGKLDDSKYASKNLIDAVTLEGKKYAFPLAQETSALFYNKDLVKEVPKTMEEVVEIGKKSGFKYNLTDFYLSFGLVAANGGYVYKNNNGTLDPSDIGMGNEGAIKGYKFIQDLVLKDKVMPADISEDLAKGEFMSGKTAFYISGPWNVGAAKEAGLNFGVMPLPTLNGNETPSFMGVQVGFVSEKSANKDTAFELLTYLAEDCSNIVYEKGSRIPATKSQLESDAVKKDEYISGFVKQAEKAVPMPNIPEVQAMWTPAADNLKLLANDKITPEKCGEEIVKQIKEGIKQQK
ncbi:sugar ABC transporter substrate-binding protein [Clostridium sp.]|uniref:sugar ABC transporter substrate-binding protein n=1 Tax=Clostridium sp. TaxID=1506 RepID=UPI002FCAD5FD